MATYFQYKQLTQRTFIYTSLVILGFFFVFGILLGTHRPHITLLILPGGGLTDSGEIPSHTQLRLDRAVEIFRLSDSKNFLFITLSGGTTHKPNPLDQHGYPIFEAVAASKKLIEMGISPDMIMEENFSLDTIGRLVYAEVDRFYHQI